ncbi:MAG TPA: PilN domain-containing protein [Gemmatimonadales bacterium]|jgi:Tfp pilus assembly protein PilN|nr:PilN domain-containing protein [Gemmatimonadales bacterium]
MIKINLLPGVKRKRSGSAKDALLGQMKDMGARVKDPMLIVAVVAWVLAAGWLAYGFLSNTKKMRDLEPRLEQAKDEHRRYRNLMTEKRRTESIRDSLLAQIGIIRTVDGDRYTWPHVLDEVTKALPAYTWLVTLNSITPAASADSADTTAPALQFQIEGRTVDIQAYTRFLRQLEASPWITDVTPLQASTVVENQRAVTAFSIRATFARADSAYIRTVPMSQSVR